MFQKITLSVIIYFYRYKDEFLDRQVQYAMGRHSFLTLKITEFIIRNQHQIKGVFQCYQVLFLSSAKKSAGELTKTMIPYYDRYKPNFYRLSLKPQPKSENGCILGKAS